MNVALLFCPAAFCIALAIACHVRFTRFLRKAHPDLWPLFLQLFAAFPGLGSEPHLREEFASRLTDVRTRRLYRVRGVMFAIALVITAVTVMILLAAFYARPFA